MQVLHELWDFVIYFTIQYIRGENLCAQLLLHFGFCDAVLHELWDLSVYFKIYHYQVMHVYVRKIKVNTLHDCITIVLGKELFMGEGGFHVLGTHF